MSNFMQIGDAKNDIVLIENNVSGDQLTTTLTKANGEPISSPPVTLPSGGGANLVDLGTLTPDINSLTTSEMKWTGSITPENYSKLGTPNTVVKVSLLMDAENTVTAYGIISDFSNYAMGYLVSSLTIDGTYNVSLTSVIITADGIIAKVLQIRKIDPESGVDSPEDTTKWQSVRVADQDNKLYVEREVPKPSATNAGKVLVVNESGTGYEVSDIIGKINTGLAEILGV